MKKQIYILVILLTIFLIGCERDGIFSIDGLTLDYGEEGMEFIDQLSYPIDLALNDDGENAVALGHNSQEARLFIHESNNEIKWMDNFELERLRDRFNRLSNFIKMPSGHFFISGIMGPASSSELDVSFIRKVSPSGKEEWTKTYTDSTYNYWSRGIIPINENRILLFSEKTIHLSTEVNDYNLSIVNLEGEVIKSKDIINRNNEIISHQLFAGIDGSFFVSTISFDENAIGLSHYDSELNLLWNQKIPLDQDIAPYRFKLLPNQWGGILLLFSTEIGSGPNTYIKVLSLNNDGNLIAEKGQINSNWDDSVVDAIPTKDGNILILANSFSGDREDRDILLSKMDSNGNILWSVNYGGSKTDLGHKVIETQSGNIILFGYQWNNSRGNDIFKDKTFMLRLTANGELL
ncbi:MAG: hypothetical protein Sapg2KO_01950 [Saprospiraceae bacterium]